MHYRPLLVGVPGGRGGFFELELTHPYPSQEGTAVSASQFSLALPPRPPILGGSEVPKVGGKDHTGTIPFQQ